MTPEGRVVLLDFGLVADMAASRLYESLQPKLVGTPAYLAPEQAAAQQSCPRSDWYSVGSAVPVMVAELEAVLEVVNPRSALHGFPWLSL